MRDRGEVGGQLGGVVGGGLAVQVFSLLGWEDGEPFRALDLHGERVDVTDVDVQDWEPVALAVAHEELAPVTPRSRAAGCGERVCEQVGAERRGGCHACSLVREPLRQVEVPQVQPVCCRAWGELEKITQPDGLLAGAVDLQRHGPISVLVGEVLNREVLRDGCIQQDHRRRPGVLSPCRHHLPRTRGARRPP